MGVVARVKDLKKVYRYGVRGLGVLALDGISFEIREGEVFGLIGPNGAGKSTTIKILLGLLKPSGGECEIFGEPPNARLRAKIGYLPEAPYFYRFLTGLELVEFYAQLCGMNRASAREAARRALDIVGLSDASDRRVGAYSKGMMQRAGIAQAIVHDPKFVILDEPASGLDPIGAENMAEIVRRLREAGKTVLLCSHMLSEVEKLCSRVALLSDGKIAAMGEIDALLTRAGRTRVEFSDLSPDALSAVERAAQAGGARVESVSAAKISLGEFFRETLEEKK